MGEQILTSEEVDAILKVTQEKSLDLGTLSTNIDASSQQIKKYSYALSDINDAIRSDVEKNLSALLRKRVIIKTKSSNFAPVSACLTENGDKNTLTVFRLLPSEQYGIFLVDMPFIDQAINLLFGGKVIAGDTPITIPGKVGLIISEKIADICLSAFIQACKDYGETSYDILKTAPTLNVASNLGLTMDEQVYFIVLSVFFDEVETSLTFMIAEQFLSEFIPAKNPTRKHKDKDFWRTAIKTQVVDSMVVINVALPDINLKVKDFLELKTGDVIPISDPTLVYVCLNSLKLFRAVAGQANSKLVVKVLNQI